MEPGPQDADFDSRRFLTAPPTASQSADRTSAMAVASPVQWAQTTTRPPWDRVGLFLDGCGLVAGMEDPTLGASAAKQRGSRHR